MVVKSRGSISFDAMTDEAFEDLVRETLEQSEYITVDELNVDAETDRDLIIYEVF